MWRQKKITQNKQTENYAIYQCLKYNVNKNTTKNRNYKQIKQFFNGILRSKCSSRRTEEHQQ